MINREPVPPPASFLAELADVVGPAHVVTDPDVVDGYAVDWTGRWRGAAAAVVRPASVDEVAEVMRCCRRAGVGVVAQGGNSGLVGGAVPVAGEIVLSLRRLDHLGPVEPVAGQVEAGAGATLAALHRHVAGSGWRYAVDFGGREVATVGGTVATNAGGIRAFRYGMTRRQVVGIEAVTGAGDVLRHVVGLDKDNTGYDLAGLLCGSEGTLAVVTAARLRLMRDPGPAVVAAVAFDHEDRLWDAAGIIRATLDGLDALEFVSGRSRALVAEAGIDVVPLGGAGPALVVEAVGVDAADRLAGLGASLNGAVDAAVASSAADAARIWRLRDGIAEVVARRAGLHKLDVTVPLHRIAAFGEEVTALIASVAPGASVWLFGHAADGNVHVNVTEVPDDRAEVLDRAVLELVAASGGSISAEHGIGTAKARHLDLARSPAERAVFEGIRSVFDPDGILNRRVLRD